MKRANLVYLAFCLVLVVIAFAIGTTIGKKSITYLTGEINKLQNGWTEAQSKIGEQQDINDRLKGEAEGLQKANKSKAFQIALLRAQLKEITGSGPADIPEGPEEKTLATFEDNNVKIRYYFSNEMFNYILKPRPITLTIVENKNKVSAKVWDIKGEQELEIEEMTFTRLPFAQPKRWYSNLHLGLAAGYNEGLLVGVSGGYGKTKIIAFSRLAEKLVPGLMLHRDLF